MAGAEYEVNISLNTKTINAQLKTLETRLSKISRAADPLGSGAEAREQVKNLDRIRATGVIINRLGRELNKLEAQGVKVQNERSRIKRAIQKLDKGLVETARAHVVEIRDFVKEANKGLKTKEKTVKLDNVQAKFAHRKARALARSNERNEKDLRLNQRMTADARARMRLLSQSGAQAFIKSSPLAQGRQLADDIDARLKAQEKSARLANRINELEVKGVNVAKHRKQLGKIRTAQADGLFGLAAREVRVLRKSLELEQSKLRILKEQSKFLAGGPMRFPSGRRVTSPFDVGPARPLTQAAPSSFIGQKQLQDIELFERKQQRAALNAHFRQLGFIQKETKAKIAATDKALKNDQKALADFDKSLSKAIADRQNMFSKGVAKAGVKPDSVFGPLRQLGQASMVAGANEAKLLAGRFRAPSSPLTARPVTRASADQAAKQVEQEVRRRTALDKRAADQAAAYRRRVNKQVFRAKLDLDRIEYKQKIDDIVNYTNREIQEGNRAGREFDKELKRRSKKREADLKRGSKRLGDVALGAGFPLLFGGGPGSVIGGGLGGLTGSFGAQIGLSAAGQQIDQLIGRTITSAESLTSVGKALDFLRDRSLFSSKESEQLARKLENQGDLTGIATLVTEELNEALGPDGIQKMQDLAEQTKLAKEQWGQLTTNLELLISGPLTEFLAIVNATLGIKVAQSNFARSLSRLQERDPERLKGLLPSFEGAKDPAKAIASNLAFGPNMAGGVFNMQGLSEGSLISFTEQMNSILRSMDPSGGTIPITEEDKKRFKRKGPKNKLPELEAEREKLKKLLNLEEKRFGFELKGDQAAIARMQASERVAEIAEEIRNIKASDLTDEEKRVALEAQGIENARVNLELGFKLAKIEKDRAAQINELRIKTEEMNPVYQQQLQLAEGIADTFGTTMLQAFDAMVAGTERFDVAIRKLVAGALNDMARKLFQIFVIEQAIRSIGAAFAPPPIFGSGGGVDRFGRGTLGPNYGIRQFANGGNPPVGRPSIVGERGPELFVPRTAGTIIPNHAMGSANVTVNVDASGSSVEGNSDQAAQLGRMLGAAVQAELVKQKRPGGLLAS